VVNAIALPILFISDVFVPVDDGILVVVGELLPVRHLSDALQSLWNTAPSAPFDPLDVVAVAVWGLGGLLVALRTFSWEPHP
jgi:ABC-2 type transport system permease protein